jgi:hypothetical protein
MTERIKVDVRVLPRWQQYLIAVTVVVLVLVAVVLSWQSGQGPDPTWSAFIERFIVPYAGWIGIAAGFFVAVRYLLGRRAR